MKDILEVIKAILAFGSETVFHPDPNKRTGFGKILILLFSVTISLFLYNYGGTLIDIHRVKDIREENIKLQREMRRVQRKNLACTADLAEITDRYDKLVGTGVYSPEIGSGLNDDIYNRLEKLQ